MATYGGVDFTALEDGWSEPATSAVNVKGFPGGNSVAISLGGQREVTRSVTGVFPTRGQYVSLALMRGQEHALFVNGWDTGPVDAVLKEANPDPPRPDGQVFAKLQFILT